MQQNVLIRTSRCLVVVALWHSCAAQAAVRAADEPDPLALLRAVETARRGIPSARMEMTSEYTSPSVQNSRRIEIVMEGDRRHFTQTAATKRVRAVFDGEQVLHYDGGSATIRDLAQPTSDYMFDPRTLGITASYLWHKSVAGCLGYRDAQSVSLMGAERIKGRRVWHVRVVDTYGQQLDFWIEPKHGFPVHRYEFRTQFQHCTTTAEYDEADGQMASVLPNRVETVDRDQNGRARGQRIVTVERVDFNVAIPPETWTLAGLNLAVGTPVGDLRIRQRIGYWDGRGLSKDPPRRGLNLQANAAPPLQTRSGRSWNALVIANAVVLAGLALVFLYRRLRRNDAASSG